MTGSTLVIYIYVAITTYTELWDAPDQRNIVFVDTSYNQLHAGLLLMDCLCQPCKGGLSYHDQ